MSRRRYSSSPAEFEILAPSLSSVTLTTSYTANKLAMRGSQDGGSLSHLETIPDDVLGHVFRRLDIRDLIHLEQVSKTLKQRVSAMSHYSAA